MMKLTYVYDLKTGDLIIAKLNLTNIVSAFEHCYLKSEGELFTIKSITHHAYKSTPKPIENVFDMF